MAPEPRPCSPLLPHGPVNPHHTSHCCSLLGKASQGSSPRRPRLGLASLCMRDSEVLAPGGGCGPIQWVCPLVTVHWGGIAWGAARAGTCEVRGLRQAPSGPGPRTEDSVAPGRAVLRTQVRAWRRGQRSPDIRMCRYLLNSWPALPSVSLVQVSQHLGFTEA